MRQTRLVPVEVIWFKVIIGVTFAVGLALWGWLRPDVSLPLMGQSISVSVRIPLLALSGVLFFDIVFYAWREGGKWLDAH